MTRYCSDDNSDGSNMAVHPYIYQVPGDGSFSATGYKYRKLKRGKVCETKFTIKAILAL
ncbi:hypothetical protein GF312_19380 [Candidatus Poribacteria bacterium]|nr:hypothetical protein [Candidatus Poribacteria bacterium]